METINMYILKRNIKNVLTVTIFNEDFRRLEKVFNKLAIKNADMYDEDETHICFSYKGMVFPHTYADVKTLPLHKKYFENADRLIRQQEAIRLARQNTSYIVRQVLSYSKNCTDILNLLPKELHKYLPDFDFAEEEYGPASYTEKEIEKWHEKYDVYLSKIKRYLVNKALFFNQSI